MSETQQDDENIQPTPTSEPVDDLEQLRRDIERQIRSNERFLESFLDENFTDEEE